MMYIIIYIIGFLVTAYINAPKDAMDDDNDIVGQTGIALLWPILALVFVLLTPVFIVAQLNKLRK